MALYNKNVVLLIGQFGRDPEIRYTPNGKKVATMSLATTEFSGKGEERREFTEWHRLVAFGRNAELIEEYTKKGSYVDIEGSLRYRSYVDDQKITRYVTEIIINRIGFLDRRPAGEQPGEYAAPANASAPAAEQVPIEAYQEEAQREAIPF